MIASPDEFQKALTLFNQKAFFECHEVLEDLWRPLPPGPKKTFLQGLIQVAVGFHHLQNRNFVGARNKLQSGLAKLEAVQADDSYQPAIALDPVTHRVRQALETVLALGPGRLADFPAEQIPHIPEAPPDGGASVD